MDDKPIGDRDRLMKSLGKLRMSSTVWEQIGYKYSDMKRATNEYDGIWLRKLFQPDGHERSDSLGWMQWNFYRLEDRTAYMAEANLDMSKGPIGLRRMTWSPTELTVEVVRMVEEEYKYMSFAVELFYKSQKDKP